MIITILVLCYLLTRLPNLLSLPIFLDEALYLRMTNDLLQGEIWVSFTDGKEPLFFWTNALFVSALKNALFAGRFFSVLSGLGTLLFSYALGSLLFNKRVAFVTGLLIIFSPFLLFYNRLSLLDSFLTMLLAGFVFFQLKAVKQNSWPASLVAGIFFGLALTTKTLAQIYVFVLPLSLIFGFAWRSLAITSLTAGLIYLPLTLTPNFKAIAIKNEVFRHPFIYALEHLNEVLIPNLKTLLRHWAPFLLGIVPLAVFILASVVGILRKNKPLVFLFLLAILPIILQSFVAKIFFPRYFLFTTIPILLIISWGINFFLQRAPSKSLALLIFLAVVTQPIYSSSNLLLVNDSRVLPEIEKWQYYYGFPSGYCLTAPLVKITGGVQISKNGVAEVVKFRKIKNNNPEFRLVNFYEPNVNLTKIEFDHGICQQPPKLYKLK